MHIDIPFDQWYDITQILFKNEQFDKTIMLLMSWLQSSWMNQMYNEHNVTLSVESDTFQEKWDSVSIHNDNLCINIKTRYLLIDSIIG